MHGVTIAFAALLTFSGVLAGHNAPNVGRHAQLASRYLQGRDGSARATFYKVGLGACGGTNGDSDFVVAMNADGFAGGSACNKMITINYNGQSTQAQVVDLCPTCPGNAIDMSIGLFSFFVPPGDIYNVGQIFVDWSFGGPPAPSSTTSTSSTSTWSQPTTSSTSTSSSSTSTSTSTSTSSSSSSSSSSVASTTSSSSSSASAAPSSTPNLESIANIVLSLGQTVLKSSAH